MRLAKETEFLEMPAERRCGPGESVWAHCDFFSELVERIQHLFFDIG